MQGTTAGRTNVVREGSAVSALQSLLVEAQIAAADSTDRLIRRATLHNEITARIGCGRSSREHVTRLNVLCLVNRARYIGSGSGLGLLHGF